MLSGASKFTDLPQQQQQELQELETYIETQSFEHKENRDYGKEIADTEKLAVQLRTLLERDAVLIDALKEDTARELKYADGCSKYIDKFNQEKLPLDTLEFFRQLTDRLEHRTADYAQRLEEIEHYIRYQDKMNPQAIQDSLNEQKNGLLHVARDVALVHEKIQGMS